MSQITEGYQSTQGGNTQHGAFHRIISGICKTDKQFSHANGKI